MSAQPCDERRHDARDVFAARTGDNSDSANRFCVGRHVSQADSTLAFIATRLFPRFSCRGGLLRIEVSSAREGRIPDFLRRRSRGSGARHRRRSPAATAAASRTRSIARSCSDGIAHDSARADSPRSSSNCGLIRIRIFRVGPGGRHDGGKHLGHGNERHVHGHQVHGFRNLLGPQIPRILLICVTRASCCSAKPFARASRPPHRRAARHVAAGNP